MVYCLANEWKQALILQAELKQLFVDDRSDGDIELDPNSIIGIGRFEFDRISTACGQMEFSRDAFWKYLTEDWVNDDLKGRKYRHVRHKRLTWDRFQEQWHKLISLSDGDDDAIFFRLLLGNHPDIQTLSGEAFEPLLQSVINDHRELHFLRGNTQFEAKYIETVITRIFFAGSRSPPPLDSDILAGDVKGMTCAELKRTGLRDIISRLSSMSINDERHYFSYKHFFVIYCKYYDLDVGTSSRVSSLHLKKYEGNALNPLICRRIVDGHGLSHCWRVHKNGEFKLRSYVYNAKSIIPSSLDSGVDLGVERSSPIPPFRNIGLINYYDFMWFILAEEDRSSPASLEYWFRILDIDGDGVVSLYELEQFWREQEFILSHESLHIDFCDVVCVSLETIKNKGKCLDIWELPEFKVHRQTHQVDRFNSHLSITLADIKRNPQSSARFFDYFINWRKLVERESTNGNRLYREIDEQQQAFFQQLNCMPSKGPEENGPFCISQIPSDNRSSWARWADLEYDHYIIQEEVEKQRKQLASVRLSRTANGQGGMKWVAMTDTNDEELFDQEAFDWDSFTAPSDSPFDMKKRAGVKIRKSRKTVRRRTSSKSLSASFKIKTSICKSPPNSGSPTKSRSPRASIDNEMLGCTIPLEDLIEEHEDEFADSFSSSDSDDDIVDDETIDTLHRETSHFIAAEHGRDMHVHWADLDPNETASLSPFSPRHDEMMQSPSPIGTASKEHHRLSRQLSPTGSPLRNRQMVTSPIGSADMTPTVEIVSAQID
eukprot:Partr_v1_DN28029_c0_g1_i2_m57701 putative Protein phosphatase 2, regulatory subunit B